MTNRSKRSQNYEYVDGERVATIRRQKGISKLMLAKMAGCSPTHLTNIETGKSLYIRTGVLSGLSKALNVPIESLIGRVLRLRRSDV